MMVERLLVRQPWHAARYLETQVKDFRFSLNAGSSPELFDGLQCLQRYGREGVGCV